MGEIPVSLFFDAQGAWTPITIEALLATSEPFKQNDNVYTLTNHIRSIPNIWREHTALSYDQGGATTRAVNYDGLRQETLAYMLIVNTSRPIIYNSSYTGEPFAKYSMVLRTRGNFVVDPKADTWSRILAAKPNKFVNENNNGHQKITDKLMACTNEIQTKALWGEEPKPEQLAIIPLANLALRGAGRLVKGAIKSKFNIDVDKIMQLLQGIREEMKSVGNQEITLPTTYLKPREIEYIFLSQLP